MDNENATKQDIRDLRQELRQELQELESRVVDKMTELVRDIETKLLTAFHGYGRGQAARMHELETNDHATDLKHRDVLLRMAALEDRVLNLETRR